MAVYRDKRNERWFFKTMLHFPDGTRRRASGVPGVPGKYHDLGQSKAGAIAAEKRAITRALGGRDAAGGPIPESEVPTIQIYSRPFLDEYAAEHKPSERRSKEQILNGHILPFFGPLRLDQLELAHVKRFAAIERKRGCAVKTINNRLAVLSSLVKYAVSNHVIEDPKIKFSISGESHGARPAAVPMGDVERLLASAPDARHRVAVLLGAEAGLRAGEIRGLQWGDVADGQLTIRRALDTESDEVVPPKHNKVRTVPLSDRLVDEFAALPKRGLWIVGRLNGALLTHAGLYDAIVELYDRAGVEKPSQPIHCLRHTFGTETAGGGTPLATLQDLMGHADIKTTLRYIDVSDAQKRAAIAGTFGRGSVRHVSAEVRGSVAAAGSKRKHTTSSSKRRRP